MVKVKIIRSYSEKRQLRQFEPAQSGCGAEVEFEIKDLNGNVDKEFTMHSEGLDEFCRREVAKTFKEILGEKEKTVNKKSVKAEVKEKSKDAAENDMGAGIGDV